MAGIVEGWESGSSGWSVFDTPALPGTLVEESERENIRLGYWNVCYKQAKRENFYSEHRNAIVENYFPKAKLWFANAANAKQVQEIYDANDGWLTAEKFEKKHTWEKYMVLAKALRDEVGMTYHTGFITDKLVIPKNHISNLTNMLIDMRMDSSYPVSKGTDQVSKQEELAEDMEYGFKDMAEGVWPNSIPKLKVTQNKRLALSDYLVSHKAKTGDLQHNLLLDKALKGLSPENANILKTGVEHMTKNYGEGNPSKEPSTSFDPESSILVQDANLDRFFNMMWQFNSMSKQNFKIMAEKVEKAFQKPAGKDTLMGVVSDININEFTSVMAKPDSLIELQGVEHKYQPPLLATRKRTLGTLSCVSLLPTPECLKMYIGSGHHWMAYVSALYIIDRHTGSRAAQRNSLHIFHHLIRDIVCPYMYGGFQKGNALSVNLVEGDPEEIVLHKTQKAYFEKVSNVAEASDSCL